MTTLASWNVNSIRMRLPRLVGWLERRQPDLVCLQETKVTDDQFPRDAMDALGYHVLANGERTYNGVAILARRPLMPVEVARTLPGDGSDAQRRLLAADVGDLRVVNVYGPNGQEVGSDKYRYKLDWYRRLQAWLPGAAVGRPVAVCGDLNIAPEDLDVHDPEGWRGKIMCSEPERAAFRDLLASGLTDALRLLRPGERGLYTWWDYRAGAFHRGWGLRIDHVLLSQPLASRLRLVEIDRDERKGKQPSDHAPVVVTLGAA